MPTEFVGAGDNLKFRKACDLCHKKHLACDRGTPSCSSCLINQTLCTRERHFTYPSTRHQNVKTFSCLDKEGGESDVSIDLNFKNNIVFKPYNPKKSRSKATDKSANTSQLQAHLNALNLSYKSPSPASRQLKRYEKDWIVILQKWYIFPSSQRFFYYFTNLSGLSILKSSSAEKVFIIDTFINKMSVLGMEKKVVLHLNISPSDTASLLEMAKQYFFFYFNPFLPLFTVHGYENRKRSPFLQFSIWRVGLQFVGASKLKDSLLDYIDNQLLDMLKPSAISFCFDSLQALLLLFMAVNQAPILKKREAIHSMIQSTFFALGLHSQSTTFNNACTYSRETLCERELARRVIICYFSFYFWSVGEPVFTLGCMASEKKNKLFTSMVFEKKVGRRGLNTNTQEDSPFGAIHTEGFDTRSAGASYTFRNAFSYPDFEAVNWDSLDCSLLHVSKFYNDEAVLRLEHGFKLNYSQKKIPLKYLEQTLRETLLRVHQLFFSCISSLCIVQEKVSISSKSWLGEQAQPRAYTENPFQDINLRFYKDGTLEINQMIVFAVLRYHFSRIEILKHSVRVETECNPTASPRVLLSMEFIIAGLKSAVQIIQIINLLGSGPFLFMRYNFLFSASQFIIQYYHTYTNSVEAPLVMTTEASFGTINDRLDLRGALRCSRKQLESTVKTFATYQVSSLFSLLNALLVHHRIPLDP